MTTYQMVREQLLRAVMDAAASLEFDDPSTREKNIAELLQLAEATDYLAPLARDGKLCVRPGA